MLVVDVVVIVLLVALREPPYFLPLINGIGELAPAPAASAVVVGLERAVADGGNMVLVPRCRADERPASAPVFVNCCVRRTSLASAPTLSALEKLLPAAAADFLRKTSRKSVPDVAMAVAPTKSENDSDRNSSQSLHSDSTSAI